MIIAWVGFSRFIALSFGGKDMDQDRAVAVIPDILQGFNQPFKLMAGNGSDIFKLQGFKEHAGSKKPLQAFLGFSQHGEDIFTH